MAYAGKDVRITVRFSNILFLTVACIVFCWHLTGGTAVTPETRRDSLRLRTEPDTIQFTLEPITVSGLRFPDLPANVPFSITPVDRFTIQTARKQLSLNESLGSVPGVYGLNSTNFSQDLRIAIRGFGARSSFGIRGIRVLVDGIPETTADGQTSLDILNLGLLDRIEIIRGPLSAVYGNASGGVINLYTRDTFDKPYLESRITSGSDGFRQYRLGFARNLGKMDLFVSGMTNTVKGYRDHSAMEDHTLNTRLQYRPDSLTTLKLRLDWEHSPFAQDPGGLTIDQVRTDRKQAYPVNLAFDAGEVVHQHRISVAYERALKKKRVFELNAYMTNRDFRNRLPFSSGGIVHLDRFYYGGSAALRSNGSFFGQTTQIQTGIDVAVQNDDRQRFDNISGRRGQPVFHQDEKYSGLGVFLQDRLLVGKHWRLQFGGRYDIVMIKADDHYMVDGDQSGQRKFQALTGMLGILYEIHPALHVFASSANAFETPALIELSNNPSGTGGLNDKLNPQKSVNLEAGAKGRLYNRFRYELTLFTVHIRDELVPFEQEDMPGRSFYSNAGSSIHRGVETGVNGILYPGLNLAAAYTFSDFFFLETHQGENTPDGNKLPGIPAHHFYTELFYTHSSGMYGRLECNADSKIFTSDGNDTWQDGYWMLNLQMGIKKRYGSWEAEPFFAINNLFSAEYADNIRINAFGGRYFEPAPGASIYGGFSLQRYF